MKKKERREKRGGRKSQHHIHNEAFYAIRKATRLTKKGGGKAQLKGKGRGGEKAREGKRAFI